MRPTPYNTNGTSQASRLVGYVQVRIGSQVYALAVQAVPFSKDGQAHAGGFFADTSGHIGILVDGNATPEEQRAQIAKATEDAVTHLSRPFLN